MTMITPSYLGETIEYSSLHACRSTLEDPTGEIGAHATTPATQATIAFGDTPAKHGNAVVVAPLEAGRSAQLVVTPLVREDDRRVFGLQFAKHYAGNLSQHGW